MILVPAARRHPILPAAAVVLLAGCLGGLLHHNAYHRVPADHLVHQAPADGSRTVRLRGHLLTAPRMSPNAQGPFAAWMFAPDRCSFVIEANSIEGPGGYQAATGQVRVTVKEAVLDVAVGDHVELFGKLYRPPPPGNPGQFDWARWSRRHGIHVGLSCGYRECIITLDDGAVGSWHRGLGSLRSRARGVLLDDMLDRGGDEMSLLAAMVLASRSDLDPSIREAFVEIGAAHYLAVSGFHVGMLAFFVYGAGRLLGLTRRRSAVVVVVLTIAYAILAEPRPPIFRATVLAVAVCASLIARRESHTLNWLALSALAYLVWKPMDLFDVGFQMSYVCVLGIVTLTPAVLAVLLRPVTRVLRRSYGPVETLIAASTGGGMWRRLVESVTQLPMSVTLAAWLSSLPLLLYYFHHFLPLAWLTTLLVFPLVVLVMFAGFGALLVGLVSPWLAGLLTPLVECPAGWLLWWVERIGQLPGTSVYTLPPSLVWVVLYYVTLAGWIAHHRASSGSAGQRRQPAHQAENAEGKSRASVTLPVAATCSVLLAVATVLWLAPRGSDGRLTATVLSVGRGTAIVLELPDGGALLYDAGSSGSYDPGQNAVIPYLAHRGINRLEAAVISHPNLDHFSGLPSVIDRVAVSQVMLAPYFELLSPPGTASHRLLEELRQRGQSIDNLDAGTGSFELGGAPFEVLWPPVDAPFELDANDSSIVLRVSHAGSRILLTGDIEEAAQACLLRSGRDLSADVLILPHHGSVVGNTKAFIEAVQPTCVIASTSERSGPRLERLLAVLGDRTFFNTAEQGAIRVELDGSAVGVSALLDRED